MISRTTAAPDTSNPNAAAATLSPRNLIITQATASECDQAENEECIAALLGIGPKGVHDLAPAPKTGEGDGRADQEGELRWECPSRTPRRQRRLAPSARMIQLTRRTTRS